MKIYKLITIWIFISLFLPVNITFAQDQSEYPLYIVQNGDTLSQIAQRFGTSVEELITVNGIQNPDTIPTGTSLKIPGFNGINGTLEFQAMPLGETLLGLSIKNNIPLNELARLNRIVSPEEVYAGSNLIITKPINDLTLKPLAMIDENSNLIDISIGSLKNPWMLSLENKLSNNWSILPKEIIYSSLSNGSIQGISGPITKIEMDPLPLIQGKTIVIKVTTSEALALTGTLGERSISFFPNGENQFVSLTGMHAMENPGVVLLSLDGKTPSNQNVHYEQKIILASGNFSQESVNGVDPGTIDPIVIQEEDTFLQSQLKKVTTPRYWTDIFKYPVDEPCVGSKFGNRRSYNNGVYLYFHTGVDFTVCKADNANIYAAAPGIVAFSGPLPIKGNFTIIDHGWGVYSGYAHQSQMLIKVGDQVQTGQIIGIIGNTGRSIGYHLHWEIWVNGIQVDPLEWVLKPFP